MKTLVCILIMAVQAVSLNAQSVSHSVSKSKSSSSHVSITAKDNGTEYSYRASFDDVLTEKVRETITVTLGAPNDATQRTAIWETNAYEIMLRNGKVTIELEKANTSKAQCTTIKDLGDQISEVLGSPKTPEPPKH